MLRGEQLRMLSPVVIRYQERAHGGLCRMQYSAYGPSGPLALDRVGLAVLLACSPEDLQQTTGAPGAVSIMHTAVVV